MGIMGKLRVVLVKKNEVKRDDAIINKNLQQEQEQHEHFRRPGRINRSIQNGKEYRIVTYDETRPVDDLLPDEAKKQDTSALSKQLNYVLILNFDEPILKPVT